jgi:hypothetical protein
LLIGGFFNFYFLLQLTAFPINSPRPIWPPFPLIVFWITAGFVIAYQYWGPGWGWGK